MANNQKQVDFSELEREMPPVVFRNWKDWGFYLPISPRSVANLDAQGRGPKEKIQVGRVCGYPKKALIEWLKERSTVIR